MIPTEPSVSGQFEYDPRERADCDRIEEYWQKLRNGPGPVEPGSCPDRRDSSDRANADCLDVMDLLNRVRQAPETSTDGSQDATWVAPEPGECQPPPGSWTRSRRAHTRAIAVVIRRAARPLK